MSDSLWPHELQHTRLPCPSLPPRVCSNSCPLRWWWYLTISSSALFTSPPEVSRPVPLCNWFPHFMQQSSNFITSCFEFRVDSVYKKDFLYVYIYIYTHIKSIYMHIHKYLYLYTFIKSIYIYIHIKSIYTFYMYINIK